MQSCSPCNNAAVSTTSRCPKWNGQIVWKVVHEIWDGFIQIGMAWRIMRGVGIMARRQSFQFPSQLWLATERIRLWIKETDMSFLCRVLGFRLGDRVRSLDIWMEVGVQLLLFQRRQLRRYGHLIKIPSGCFLLEVCCCGKGHWEYPASLLPLWPDFK